ncbi:Integrator complex subunit 9 [Borealophlyctis nickersoniae]|nr:Integrator complex subunit 9 [Borealophlyctis nickersoniae]
MSQDRQQKLYSGESPLYHRDLMEHKLLFHHTDIRSVLDHPGPYIVFVGHPSLLGGDVALAINVWKDDPKNLLVLTGIGDTVEITTFSAFADLVALVEPRDSVELDQRSFKMEVCHCQMDMRLPMGEILRLGSKMKPRHMIITTSHGEKPPPVPDDGSGNVTFLPPLRLKKFDLGPRYSLAKFAVEEPKNIDLKFYNGSHGVAAVKATMTKSVRPEIREVSQDTGLTDKPMALQNVAAGLLDEVGMAKITTTTDGLSVSCHDGGAVRIAPHQVVIEGDSIMQVKQLHEIIKRNQ